MIPASLFILLTAAADPIEPAAGSVAIQTSQGGLLTGTGLLFGTSTVLFSEVAEMVGDLEMLGNGQVTWRAVGYFRGTGGGRYLALETESGFLVLEREDT